MDIIILTYLTSKGIKNGNNNDEIIGKRFDMIGQTFCALKTIKHGHNYDKINGRRDDKSAKTYSIKTNNINAKRIDSKQNVWIPPNDMV